MNILIFGATLRDTMATSIATVLQARHTVHMFPYEEEMNFLGDGQRRANTAVQLVMQGLRLEPTLRADRALFKYLRGRAVDLLLIISINLIPAAVITEVKRRTGALVVGWFPDAMINFGKARFLEAPYERLFFQEKVIVERLRTGLASTQFDYLPPAFDPELHCPVDASAAPPDAAVDVATFGNGYIYRAVLMEKLLAQPDISTCIYGDSARNPSLVRHYRGAIFGHEKSAAMRAARIALNTSHYACLDGVNKRTFELAGIGAFQLTDAPAVRRYLEAEKEVATFAGPGELVEKARWYLARPNERAAIAHAGLRRAWREHTYQHRLNELFARVPALAAEPALPIPELPAA